MKLFYIISSLPIFIPFIIGLVKYYKLDKNLRIIFYLVTVGSIMNGMMIYYGLIYKTNVWLGHIYTVIEFFLIVLFFYLLFEKTLFKRIMIVLMVVFTIVVVINKIYLESFDKIDNYTLTISAILLLVSSSMYLVEFLANNLIVNFRDYRFIITVSLMIYFGGNLFIFALSNDVSGIWIMHNIISTLLYLVYALIFIWYR